MIRNRVWDDLLNAVFYIEFLGLYINEVQWSKKVIKIVSLCLNLISLAGLYRFSNLNIIWMIILFLVMAFNWVKDYFTITDKELFAIEKVYSYYKDQYKEYEDLWYEIEEGDITNQQALRKYKKINGSEKLFLKLNKFTKINGKEKLRSKAEILATERISKFL